MVVAENFVEEGSMASEGLEEVIEKDCVKRLVDKVNIFFKLQLLQINHWVICCFQMIVILQDFPLQLNVILEIHLKKLCCFFPSLFAHGFKSIHS